MTVPARLFGPDREEICDLHSWFRHAPPEKRERDWRDGYSAKEQAKAWLRSGSPAVPDELWSALAPLAGAEVDEVYGRPEHITRLDRFAGPRHHDLFACARRAGRTVLVAGVEAKACETFDGLVADRAAAGPPSNKRARCNLLSRALFGREVLDERTGVIIDPGLGRHGYELWTAAVGTIIEAQERGQERAVLVVHQFLPRDRSGDGRNWPAALAANAAALDAFVAALRAAGGASHRTEFVKPGTRLDVVKVESVIA